MPLRYPRSRVLALLAAAPALGVPRVARAQAGPKIRMGAVATETYAEPLYAADSGAFTRAGLNVELTLFPSGAVLNQAVNGNALDVGTCDPIQLTYAIDHGVPYAYFAGCLIHVGDVPTTVLCASRTGTVRTAHDLEGQTIAIITLHSLGEYSIREWMTQQGADPTKARFVEIPGASMPLALARGTVAAAMLIEPYLSMATATDARVLANPYNTVAQRFSLNAFYARRDWLTANADTTRRLTAALYDGARWANTHRNESMPILAKYAKLEPAQIAAMQRATYATSLEPRLLQPVIAIATKYKAVERPLPPADLIFSA
jgi:NitT/TauT family transport system substrate-binding protein